MIPLVLNIISLKKEIHTKRTLFVKIYHMWWYVYLLASKRNGTLYIGVTNNIGRRTYEHKQKTIEGFTKKYNLTKLVYFEQFNHATNAIVAEKKIKGWLRSKKNALIESANPNWDDLSLSFWTEWRILSLTRSFAEFILNINKILRFAQDDRGEGLRMTYRPSLY